MPAAGGTPAGDDLLFVVRDGGRLVPALVGEELVAGPDDVAVALVNPDGRR
jgi:hypothetical protein